ncbi:MAG: radical SAM protein [Deltaproteobacteria bacterium]|nr:radical SAM protein [Deltaproteobacteria bacterium]
MTDKKIDILIIKPGSQKQIYGTLSAFNLTAIEPPLWAALLAGYLINLGYSVLIYDAEVEEWNHQETAKKIKEVNPILAMISVSGSNPSASTMNMTGAGSILKHLKDIAPDIKTVLHGLHPSSLPERTLCEEAVDFVCRGEGFYTLPHLIDTLKKESENFQMAGLWFKKGKKIYSNPRAFLFKNLDTLPMPAWNLLPMKKYRAHNWHCLDDIHHRQPYGVIYTSLGCPFKCSFCCINAIFGKSGIRYRSAQKVIGEIDYLVNNFGIRNIKIADELFGMNESRVAEICDLMIDRQYNLNIWAYARVDTVTPLMLKKMKKAGINWLAYGFESGSKKVLRGIRKYYSENQIEDSVRKTCDEGINIIANFMFGLPDDNYKTMRETLCLALEINAEWANFYTTMAYPGSKLYDDAVIKGLALPDTWAGYSQYAYETLPLSTNHLTAAEVLTYRDYAFEVYFRNPLYLNKISKTFGEEAARHIEKMTEHKLERKYKQFQS